MQKTDLRDYIQFFDDVFPADACETMVERFEAHQDLTEFRNEVFSFDQINCNTTPGFDDIAQAVAQAAAHYAGLYFDSLGLSLRPEIRGFEHVRLKRYAVGRDEFREHVDVADHATARRFLVCMVYLRDNDGGETAFPGLDKRVACKQGRMAVFPPLWLFPHAGLPPIAVPKYTACTLLHYL